MSLEFKNQLADFAVKLAGAVSVKIQERAMGMERSERKKIEELLENSLADIVVSSIEKTASFKTTAGLKYAEENFDNMVQMYVNQFTGKM